MSARELDGKGNQKCSECNHQSVAGLLHGCGKCPFHWAVGQWGIAWASKRYPRHRDAIRKDVNYACQNCNYQTQDRDQLAPIRDIFQRVEPGERMPAGECPECGSLCHLED